MIKIKEKFFVNQTSVNDCGAACLAMILRIYHIKVSLNEIKNKLEYSKEGISAYQIIRLSKKYGINAVGYKNMELKNAKTPFIAHVINNDLQHFVVVLEVNDKMIKIADPSVGIMNVKEEEFNKKYTKVAIIFEENQNLSNILLKNKTTVIKLLFHTFLFTLLNILFTLFFSFLISIIEYKNNSLYIYVFIIIFLSLGFLKDIINYFRSIFTCKLRLLIDELITIPTLKKIIDLPQDYFYVNGSGALISKINDLSYIKEMIFKFVEVILINIILVLISFIILCYFDIMFLIINIIFALLIYLINKNFNKKHLYESYELQIEDENLNNKIINTFNFIIPIKNLLKEEYFKKVVEGSYNKYLNKYKNLLTYYQKKDLFSSLLLTFFLIISLIIVIHKTSFISEIIFIYNIENLYLDSIYSIFSIQPLYLDFKNVCVRLKEIMNANPIVCDKVDLNIKNISFKNVSFKYENKKILNNISFDINKGDYIMVNGKTGSGKSTLFKLLLKDIKYNGNNICINKMSIKKIDKLAIKNSIGYVGQSIKLLNGTIKENIFLGDNYDELPVKVSTLDKSFDKDFNLNYLIDYKDSNISGGQISKIAIARELNANKNILVFDESTTSMDEETEREIILNIKKYYKDKTVILITHRKSNLDLFNKIINIK